MYSSGPGALEVVCFVEVDWTSMLKMKGGRFDLLIYDARFRTFGPPFIHELVSCDF